jgi:hypothetical protein
VLPSSKATHLQAPPFDVGFVIIDHHMAIISMHVGKIIMKDVLLDGGLGVNNIIEDLKNN